MTLQTNEAKLVEISVVGQITHPIGPRNEYHITGVTGEPRVLPGLGGICYSHRIGDSCVDVVGDHVEAGVSTSNFNRDFGRNLAQAGYNVYSCIGNSARVISGEARGAKGTVVGKHGGVEHVIIDFPPRTLDRLTVGDRMQVRARGAGLQIDKAGDIKVFNCDPRLLHKLGLVRRKGRLRCPVTHVIPAAVMGSGIGKSSVHSGDYDIQMFDQEIVEEYRLSTLRFGDIVALENADATFGRVYKTGAITIGVIVHSVSVKAGHGPGCCALLTSAQGQIEPVLDPQANLAKLLGLRKNLPRTGRPARRTRSRRSST